MSELILFLLRSSVWLTAALALLLLLRPVLRVLGGAPLIYRSWWLLPVVLLALAAPVPSLPVAVQLPVLVLPAALSASAPDAAPLPWGVWAALAWAAGALLVAVRNGRAQQRFQRALGALSPRGDGSWQASADPGLPALVGLWRPRIVVGPDFEQRFSAAERDMVLQHERNHQRHGDHWANGGLLLLRCAFWFHPLLPWVARRFLQDQELACDARTIDPHPALRRLYATALLKAQLAHPVAPMACHWRCQPMLKERIAMLKQSKRKILPRMSGQMLVVVMCAASAAAAWASQSAAPAAGAASRDAQVRNMSAPAYPSSAFEKGQSGVVVLHVDVDTQGRVADLHVISATNPGVFEDAALTAARKWTFEPAVKNGVAVAGAVRVPVTFSLTEDEQPRISTE